MRGSNIVTAPMYFVGAVVINGYRNIHRFVESLYDEGSVAKDAIQWLSLVISLIILSTAIYQMLILWAFG